MCTDNRLRHLLLLLALFILSYGFAAARPPAGSWAEYEVAGDAKSPPVVSFRVDVVKDGSGDFSDSRWYELTGEEAGGARYAVKFLASGHPFAPGGGVRVERYILKEGEERPLEYRDAHADGALLPQWDFSGELMPAFTGNDPFPERASYLGYEFRRTGHGTSGARSRVDDPKVLNLDPSLLIGTSRDFRDDRTYRNYEEGLYDWVEFDEDDYREMIAAGENLFTGAPAEKEKWVRREPTFYHFSKGPYPEMLYRSNYRPQPMYLDEPASRFLGDCPKKFWPGWSPQGDNKPTDYAAALEEYVKKQLPPTARNYPGGFKLTPKRPPAWETIVETACYQCRAGANGLVQEGRWQLEDLRLFNALLDVRVPVTAENLLKIDFAHLRGAARVYDTDWGAAVYGQADPEIARRAVLLAYDMGARYIWYWTSDHGHHLPYDEQLNLTRLVRKHQRKTPPRDMEKLKKSATTAIALPDGYTLNPEGLFGNAFFHLDRPKGQGATYRDVLREAALHVEKCLRHGVPFDVVVCSDAVRTADYSRVIRVRTDGSSRVHGVGIPYAIHEHDRPTREAPRAHIEVTPQEAPAPVRVRFSASADRPEAGELGATDETRVHWEATLHEGKVEYRDAAEFELMLERPGTWHVKAWTYDDAGVADVAEKKLVVRPFEEGYEVLGEVPQKAKFKRDWPQDGEKRGWHKPGFDDSEWRTLKIGATWEEQGVNYNGVAWYRIDFEVPEKWEGEEVILYFGRVNDSAKVWLNGQYLGAYNQGHWRNWNRPFLVEATEAVKFGDQNSLAVRVRDHRDGGGIWQFIKVITPRR